MTGDLGPGAVVGWLREHANADGLAGCAFLIGPTIALTCAHVVGAHLGLPRLVPAEPPTDAVTIRFEALQDEVTGRVLPGGWFSNVRAAPGGLSDIAVVRLDKPVRAISSRPAIAQHMPAEIRPVLIHGAEAGYRSYGQQVQGRMSGANIPRGWRQIDPESPARGFTVKNGFSGSPVLDDLGNVVWGMVVAVAEPSSGVAYAIPAEHLWAALARAGADTTVRISDATDRRAEDAMAKVRAEYEAQLSQRDLETERMRQELDQLRQGVRRLGRDAREAADEGAVAALDALAEGDVLPATEVLRHRMEERLAAARQARREAAAAARQLGTMLTLINSAEALKAFHQAAESDPDDFWTWIEVGRLEQVAGTLDGAAAAIDTALQAASDDLWARAVALNEHGDLCRGRGDLAAALDSYQASFSFMSRPALADAGDAGWQRELSIAHTKIGDVQRAQGDLVGAHERYEASFAIADRLARANPGNAGWQRDLSISHNKLGDVRRAQGDLAGALERYEASFTIRDRLARANPSNAGWQRDLSVSHERIGDAQQARGDLAAALRSFQASLAIADCLARMDLGNIKRQRELAIAHAKIGDVQRAQGDLPAALGSYQASFAIADRLARLDLGNIERQRELAIAHAKIGDLQEAQGDLPAALGSYQASLAIAEHLTRLDPGNAEWQRDLSVSHERIGDVRRTQGELPAALGSYQASLAIAERLARLDPGNAEWQRDLSVSHERIGDVQQARGEADHAIAAFDRALGIYKVAQRRSPDDVQARLFSVVPLWRLGLLRGGNGRADLDAALAILKPLAAADRLDHSRRGWIEAIEADVAAITD